MIDLRHDIEQRDHKDEGERIVQIRKRDVAQALPGDGAFDQRDLICLAGDRLQTGEEKQHVVTGIFPDREPDDRGERDVGIADPIDAGDAEHREVMVEQPDARQEDKEKQRGDRHQRHEDRDKEQRAQQRVEPGRPLHGEREPERENEARNDRADGVDEVIRQGLTK